MSGLPLIYSRFISRTRATRRALRFDTTFQALRAINHRKVEVFTVRAPVHLLTYFMYAKIMLAMFSPCENRIYRGELEG